MTVVASLRSADNRNLWDHQAGPGQQPTQKEHCPADSPLRLQAGSDRWDHQSTTRLRGRWERGVWNRGCLHQGCLDQGAQITDDRKGNHVENALISCLLWKDKEKWAKRVDPLCSNTTHLPPHPHLPPLPPQLTWCGSVSGVRCFPVWMVRTVSCCSTIQAGAAGSQEAGSGPPG